MNKVMIVILAAVLPVSFQTGRAVSAAGGTPVLTGSFLAGTKWGPEHQGGKYVNFKAGGIFDGREDYLQDGKDISGTFIITGGKVNLMDEKRAPYLVGGILREDPSALRFTRYLQFGGGVMLWDLNSQAPAGRSVTIGGIRAVTMGLQKGAVTTNAKFRTGPSQTAKELVFQNFTDKGEGPTTETLAYLPAGTVVVILARTERMIKVRQWENYWFFVEAEEPIDSWKKGWIFAEFVKVE